MVGCVAMRDGDADARSHRRKVRLQRQSPEGFTDGEAQDPITRRCGECMSCRRALRRRGAWRGAATTSALGSRWQRAPSARRRRPRSRQGGEVHGVARCESAGTRTQDETSASSASRKKAAGTGVLRFWVVLICRCTSCPCVKTLAQTVILHTWRKIHSRTDATKPESPSLPSPIIFPSCAQVL